MVVIVIVTVTVIVVVAVAVRSHGDGRRMLAVAAMLVAAAVRLGRERQPAIPPRRLPGGLARGGWTHGFAGPGHSCDSHTSAGVVRSTITTAPAWWSTVSRLSR